MFLTNYVNNHTVLEECYPIPRSSNLPYLNNTMAKTNNM